MKGISFTSDRVTDQNIHITFIRFTGMNMYGGREAAYICAHINRVLKQKALYMHCSISYQYSFTV